MKWQLERMKSLGELSFACDLRWEKLYLLKVPGENGRNQREKQGVGSALDRRQGLLPIISTVPFGSFIL